MKILDRVYFFKNGPAVKAGRICEHCGRAIGKNELFYDVFITTRYTDIQKHGFCHVSCKHKIARRANEIKRSF